MQHVKRLQHGKCSIEQGFVFNDLLTDYERISDHCSNVAAAIIEIYAGSFATHEYLDMLKLNHDRSFDKYYEEYRKKFVI
jgi:phosphate:Na+ symporter